MMSLQRSSLPALAAVSLLSLQPSLAAAAPPKQPNILVIWGDDIGQSNISGFTRGMMGYQTPHIDRIAREGIMFTDYYGEQSCTAGRSSFLLGQSVFRTGLSKVGLPGAKEGISTLDPTIAGLLKDQGYATGSLARITSAIVTNTCRPITASMSSTATSTTSMPRKSPKTKTIPAIWCCPTARPSSSDLARVV